MFGDNTSSWRDAEDMGKFAMALIQQRDRSTMATRTVLVAVVLSALNGCGPRTVTKPAEDVSKVYLVNAKLEGSDKHYHLFFITKNDKPVLVLWNDTQGSISLPTYNESSGVMSIKGEWIIVSNQIHRGEFSGEIQDSDKGQFAIKDQTYDLAKGGLILLSGKDSDVRVKQLSRDLGELMKQHGEDGSKLNNYKQQDIATIRLADPEIKDFFFPLEVPK